MIGGPSEKRQQNLNQKPALTLLVAGYSRVDFDSSI